MRQRLARASLRTKLVLAAVAIVVGALALAFAAGIGRDADAEDVLGGRPLRVSTTIVPRTHLFGDTVSARINIAADRRRVVPGSIRIKTGFGAYSVVSPPTLERRQGEATEYLVWRTKLRCLKSACVPKGEAPGRRTVFPPARIGYELVGETAETARSRFADWPALTVYSRVDQIEVAELDPRGEPPWRADLVPLPEVSYRSPPLAVAGFFLGVGGAMILGAVALLAPRRRREVPPAPIAVQAQAPMRPFDRALMLLEQDSATTESRRRALEFLAVELGRRGEVGQQLSARRLAWSEEPPSFEETRALVRSVRGEREGQ